MFLTTSIIAFLLVAIFPTGEAAAFFEIQIIEPGRPEVCMNNGQIYKVGETWNDPKNCVSISCGKGEPGTVVLKYYGCGVVAGPDDCQIVEDKSKPHPQCRPTLKCP